MASLEYIKHDRDITPHDEAKYGKLSDHDLQCECLLLYELGEITDKNGTEVNIDKKFLDNLVEKTNEYIHNKAQIPFAEKVSGQFGDKSIDEVQAIPLIKNHKSDEVENQVGYSVGLLYQKEFKGIPAVYCNVRIIRDTAKKEVTEGLLRAISIGTRPDGSIKEISFVANEAAPLCGLMFSEQNLMSKILHKKRTMQISAPNVGLILGNLDKSNLSEKPINSRKRTIKANPSLELSEKIGSLQLAEKQIENKISNHYIISRMINRGKIRPFKYDELINMDTPFLQLMEQSIAGYNITKMHGTSRKPEYIPNELTQEKQFSESIKKARKNLKLASQENEPIEMVHHSLPFEEVRKDELNRILELAEPDSHVAQYIKYELGEEVIHPKYPDITLRDYLAQLNSIKTEIKSLTLQFEETK